MQFLHQGNQLKFNLTKIDKAKKHFLYSIDQYINATTKIWPNKSRGKAGLKILAEFQALLKYFLNGGSHTYLQNCYP